MVEMLKKRIRFLLNYNNERTTARKTHTPTG